MIAFVYDTRMVPFLWPNLRPVKPDHLVHDHECLIRLPNGRVPLYPFSCTRATFLMPFCTSTCTVKLDTREAVIDFVTSKFLIRTNKDTRKRLLLLQDEEFFDTLRMTCALKSWRLQGGDEARVYKLFGDLMDSPVKSLSTVFQLVRDGKPVPQLWASTLTFLSRSEALDEQRDQLSEFYTSLLDRAHRTLRGWRTRLTPLLTFTHVSDIHLLAALLSLRGGS